MSSIRGLNSIPSAALSILSLPWHAWDSVIFPIPKLTSAHDTDGTTFFAPLAYLAATLLTALYFSQVWLFTMSAFGVVWLDSQMAWRAQQVRGDIFLILAGSNSYVCTDRKGKDATAYHRAV
jgi:hypothetical protein